MRSLVLSLIASNIELTKDKYNHVCMTTFAVNLHITCKQVPNITKHK